MKLVEALTVLTSPRLFHSRTRDGLVHQTQREFSTFAYCGELVYQAQGRDEEHSTETTDPVTCLGCIGARV